MKRLAIQLFRDEAGVVVTPEIIIITTVGLLSLIAGWNAVSNALAAELGDVANSVAALDQSYSYRGISAGVHATCSGGGFADNNQTFTVNPVDVTVSGPGADGEITINIPEISADAAAVNANAASADQEVAVFEVERIEQLNAQGAAVSSAAASSDEDCEEELKSLLSEMEKLCKRVEQLKAARKDK